MKKKLGDFIGFIICVWIVFPHFCNCGFPMEVFAKTFPKALLSLNRISLINAKVLYVFLDITATTIAITSLDEVKGVCEK